MATTRQVADRLTEAMNNHDVDGMAKLYSPDAIVTAPGQSAKGRGEIKEMMEQFMTAFPDFHGETEYTHTSGKHAIDEWVMTGTHRGPLPGPDGQMIPATGRRVHVRGCDVSHIQDGVVVEQRMYWDTMEMMSQLGLMEM